MKKKSTTTTTGVAEAPRRRGRPPKAAQEMRVQSESGAQTNDDDAFGPDDLLSLADLRSTHEPDPREHDPA